jgi:hypothetical protein
MIAATRKTATELDDGTLEVIVHVHAGSKAEFFAASPKPGDWLTLAAREKPPTQGATPAGTEAPPVGITAAEAGLADRARKLAANPQFQLYVEETAPLTAPGQDAEKRAAVYVRATIAGIGGLANDKKLDSIEASFNAWRAKKGMQ